MVGHHIGELRKHRWHGMVECSITLRCILEDCTVPRYLHVYQHTYISRILATNPKCKVIVSRNLGQHAMLVTGIRQVANCQLVRAGRGQQQLLKLTAQQIGYPTRSNTSDLRSQSSSSFWDWSQKALLEVARQRLCSGGYLTRTQAYGSRCEHATVPICPPDKAWLTSEELRCSRGLSPPPLRGTAGMHPSRL